MYKEKFSQFSMTNKCVLFAVIGDIRKPHRVEVKMALQIFWSLG